MGRGSSPPFPTIRRLALSRRAFCAAPGPESAGGLKIFPAGDGFSLVFAQCELESHCVASRRGVLPFRSAPAQLWKARECNRRLDRTTPSFQRKIALARNKLRFRDFLEIARSQP